MILGASSSSATKSRSSSVGMLARLSLWRMDSTFVLVGFFLAMSDFLCCLHLRLFQKTADEILCIPRISNFDERPTSIAAVVIDGWHPQRACGGDLGGFILLLFAGYFDDQVQEVIRAVAIVDAGYEVWDVVLFLAVQRVWDGEVEVVVLYIADDLGHVFEGFGHLLFPRVGIGHHMGDVALVVAGGEDGP